MIFIQNLACKATVVLVDALTKEQKIKPALQVLQLIIKDLENFKYVEGTGEATQDRGLRALFKQIYK